MDSLLLQSPCCRSNPEVLIRSHFYDPLGRWLERISKRMGARVYDVENGVTAIEGTKLVPPWAYAWTIGHTILAKGPIGPVLLKHELVHVAQFERYGWTFVPRYLWASIVTLSYRRNRFEVEARRIAGA